LVTIKTTGILQCCTPVYFFEISQNQLIMPKFKMIEEKIRQENKLYLNFSGKKLQ